MGGWMERMEAHARRVRGRGGLFAELCGEIRVFLQALSDTHDCLLALQEKVERNAQAI
ncbi:hypothetical protein HQ576_02245, partial [bacterium]|nr:hypothetical protein [bacterium]